MSELKGKADLKRLSDKSLEDIVSSLLDSEEDLEMKTEIHNPLAMAIYTASSYYIKSEGYVETHKFIDKFLNAFRKDMVSYDRKSREEVKQMVSSLLDRERVSMSFSERLNKST